jgi:glycosyltransferase involved in cell wall biosynthesis
MNPADITPLILTFNEAPNIGRCLERLRWAPRVLVMDSGSTDETLAICASFPNVEVVARAFDSFAGQCNAGLALITTEWVLSMDADYLLAQDFVHLAPQAPTGIDGFRIGFRYCIYGVPLRACLYPPRVALYRRQSACYEDDGHGHKVRITGALENLATSIDHDDRKPLARWLDAQRRYIVLEAEKLAASKPTGWPDRLRVMIWPAAPAALIYTLFVKRLILDGWPGIFYALQRTYAELLLSLELLDRRLDDRGPGAADSKK